MMSHQLTIFFNFKSFLNEISVDMPSFRLIVKLSLKFENKSWHFERPFACSQFHIEVAVDIFLSKHNNLII